MELFYNVDFEIKNVSKGTEKHVKTFYKIQIIIRKISIC